MDWLARGRAVSSRARRPASGPWRDRDVRPVVVLGRGQPVRAGESGHSRDGKRGRRQIEYGLLTDPEGRPVAVEVFAGNTADPESFKTAITRVRDDFGIQTLIMVGNRGMITGTRIEDLRKCDGMDWITALRAPAIRRSGPRRRAAADEPVR